MKHRALGRSGLTVPPLCFGCNVFGWTVDETSSFRLLDTVLDQGLTFVDTADVYSRWVPGHSGGESETIIGKWMKARGNRNRIILATKVGMDMGGGNVGLNIFQQVGRQRQRQLLHERSSLARRQDGPQLHLLVIAEA